ncbi:FHA domain-containing protein [Brachybacterium sp. AOP43-C2-M15]|uniref:FHA domain-containing protein n=1 Tax=Brachybacterium sp. AOP43-C2-M15 TaxID=3457661 RepID=UPI004034E02F
MSEAEGTGPESLLGTGTWIKQGPATLVLRENAWVVLVPGLRKQVTEAAWEVLGQEPAPEEFLDRLVEAGELGSADKISALLFGFHDGTSGVFGVKGTTPIAVYTADGSQQVAGTEDEPFVLRSLEGVRRTAFGDLPPEDSVGGARLSAGIVPVRGFVHVTVDPAELGEAERAALAEQVEKDGRSIEDPEAAKRRASRPAPGPAKTSAPPPKLTPASATRKPGEMPPSVSRGGAGGGRSSSAAPPPETSGPNMFDGLFGGGSEKPAAPGTSAAPPSGGADGAERPAAGAAVDAAPTAAQAPDATAATTAPSQHESPQPDPAHSVAAPPSPARPEQTQTSSPPTSASRAGTSQASPSAPATASPEAVAPAGAAAASTSAPSAPRRRLVSTSLFDRKRREASSSSGKQPPTPAPAPSTSVPTPEPSEDEEIDTGSPVTQVAPVEDELESPVTQVAPVEDEPESPVTQVAPVDDAEASEDGRDDVRASSREPSTPRDPAPPHDPAPPRDPAVPPRTLAPTRAQGPAPSDVENTGAYDDLFGKTVFRRIEDAAVRRAADDEEDEGTEEPVGAAPADPGSEDSAGPEEPGPSPASAPDPDPARAAESAPTDEPGAGGGEFIDWVPGVGRTAPEIARAAAQRAAAPAAPEPAYPQVHMAERPPAPSTGSRPASTRSPAGDEPYGAHGRYWQQGSTDLPHHAGQAPPYGAPMTTGAAGQQLGFPAPAGQPPQHPGPAVNPEAAGDRVGHQGWRQGPAPARGPVPERSPAPPRPATAGRDGRPDPGRHASAPHPVAPSGPPPVQAGGTASTAFSAPSATGSGHPVGGGAVALPGLVCAHGHANSPERAVCRVCSAPLQGETRTVVRPPLGVVEVSHGERIVLDRSAVIGRRPRASRVSVSDVPQLITVPSPQQDVSRSHLELRLEGWHVVALDLGTTNGTTLHREGFEPVRLRSTEGMLLHDGDRLDLGDGVLLTFRERA